ncbi:MAG: OmpA family protein [Opitutales bacterium]|nr:OmpA family protein [Opitutales bacterium]
MEALKFVLIAIATFALATACTPRRGPNDSLPNDNMGDTRLQEVDGNSGIDEGLTEDDARGSSAMDGKVADWISNNAIPEEAKMATIYFGFDEFAVNASGRADLDAIANYAKRDGIYIVGYSDYFGTEEYNLALSDKRAQAVKTYLNAQGSATSATIQAVGEQFAVQSGTKDDVSRDRKVIVVDGNYGK